MKFILLFTVILTLYLKFGLKLTVHLKSFFKKGFKKFTDNYGILIACGKQGSGKTFYLIDYIEKSRGDLKVITNIKSYADKRSYVIYESNLYTIIDKFNSGEFTEDYIILFDELFKVVNRNTKINEKIMLFISELRKRHIYLMTSVQEWLDVPITFRRYCRYVINCKMFNFLGSAYMYNTISSGYNMKYDKDENEYIAPILSSSFMKCSAETSGLYETDEVI